MRDRGVEAGSNSGEPADVRTGSGGLREQGIFRLLYLVSAIGVGVVGNIVLAFLAGLWVMRQYGGGYVVIVVALVLGVAASFFWVYRRCCRLMNIAIRQNEEITETK